MTAAVPEDRKKVIDFDERALIHKKNIVDDKSDDLFKEMGMIPETGRKKMVLAEEKGKKGGSNKE